MTSELGKTRARDIGSGKVPQNSISVTATAATLTENSTQSTPNTTIVAVGAAVTALDVTGAGNCPTEAATNTRMVLIDDNFADIADQINKLVADVAALRVEMVAMNLAAA